MSNRQRLRDDFERETGGYRWHPWRWFFGVIGAVVAVYLASVVLGFAATPFKVGQKIANPNNVIFQYEKFHDACAGVVALDGQIVTAQKALDGQVADTKGKPDPIGRIADETSRLRTDLTGLKQARTGKAEQYNADSRKWTQNLFKSKGLPFRIDVDVTPDCDGVSVP